MLSSDDSKPERLLAADVGSETSARTHCPWLQTLTTESDTASRSPSLLINDLDPSHSRARALVHESALYLAAASARTDRV
jgi:hypothetical protein